MKGLNQKVKVLGYFYVHFLGYEHTYCIKSNGLYMCLGE